MSLQETTAAGVPASGDPSRALLDVQGLTTELRLRAGAFDAVSDVSFTVRHGEVLGIVGESGCGKSMTALTLMQLLPPAARVTHGRVLLDGVDLLSLSAGEMRRVRGKDISMVFQEPTTSLDPAFTVGAQIIETVRAHERIGKEEARERAVRILERVEIPNAARRADDYPHQFSGGMRQRVMLAIALVMRPKLVIADEPTTALDVTIQAQILELVDELRRELSLSVMLITHNLGVVHEIADRMAVMYAGEIVEIASVREIFDDPQHPYTQALLRSMPGLATRGGHLPVIPGRVPELAELPQACRFAPRCANRIAACTDAHPDLRRSGASRELRCYNPSPFSR